jgi:hypothetical protein
MFSDTHTRRNSTARVVIVGSLLVRQLNALEEAVIHDSFFWSCHGNTLSAREEPFTLSADDSSSRFSAPPTMVAWGQVAP